MWFFKRNGNGSADKKSSEEAQTQENDVLLTKGTFDRVNALRAVPKGFKMASPNELYSRCIKDGRFLEGLSIVKQNEKGPIFTYSVVGIIPVNIYYNPKSKELSLVKSNLGPTDTAKVAYIKVNKDASPDYATLRR